MAKHYRRLTGTLPRAEADALWHDLVAYRKATRQPHRIARKRYGAGYALYEVAETQEAPPEGKSDGA
jgi:hypothetical protein